MSAALSPRDRSRIDWRDLNRAMWDAKTPAHLLSPVYDVDGFKAGATSLQPREIADLGDVTGRRLAHLQCHIGLDTLSWARLGASVTGLDFSAAAVSAAEALAVEVGLEARFVCADLYDAVDTLGRESFDIVYTGVGALCWLPDIAGWARTVRDLLASGGELYLFEFHPLEWVLEASGDGVRLGYDYFTPSQGYTEGGAVDYADSSAGRDHPTVQWNHPLGEVVTSLAQAGLRIDSLDELDCEILPRFPGMTPTGEGMFRMGPSSPSLPLMYVLRASLA